jgi:hypothetical protein
MANERTPCGGRKRDGSPCPNAARPGKSTCWVHDPELAARNAEGRRRGGINRSKPSRTLPPATPDAPLATVADVAAFLAQTLNQARVGRLAVNVANCLFVGAGVLLKALETSDLEKRLGALEARRQPGSNGRAFHR